MSVMRCTRASTSVTPIHHLYTSLHLYTPLYTPIHLYTPLYTLLGMHIMSIMHEGKYRSLRRKINLVMHLFLALLHLIMGFLAESAVSMQKRIIIHSLIAVTQVGIEMGQSLYVSGGEFVNQVAVRRLHVAEDMDKLFRDPGMTESILTSLGPHNHISRKLTRAKAVWQSTTSEGWKKRFMGRNSISTHSRMTMAGWVRKDDHDAHKDADAVSTTSPMRSDRYTVDPVPETAVHPPRDMPRPEVELMERPGVEQTSTYTTSTPP